VCNIRTDYRLSIVAGKPLRLVDPQSKTAFYLVDEASLLHMQSLSEAKSEESLNRLRQLIQDGIDSVGISEADAAARLRQYALRCVQGSK
jgi:hypothetical protein